MDRLVLFSKGSLFEVISKQEAVISSEIERYDDHTVNKPIEDLCEDIYKRFIRKTPVLRIEAIAQVEKGETEIGRQGQRGRITYIKIEIPFVGDRELLFYRPSHSSLTSIEAEVFDERIRLLYAIDDRTSEDVRKEIDYDIANINDSLKNVDADLKKFHSKIKDFARSRIELRKEKLRKDREVIEGLGFPIKKA